MCYSDREKLKELGVRCIHAVNHNQTKAIIWFFLRACKHTELSVGTKLPTHKHFLQITEPG